MSNKIKDAMITWTTPGKLIGSAIGIVGGFLLGSGAGIATGGTAMASISKGEL